MPATRAPIKKGIRQPQPTSWASVSRLEISAATPEPSTQPESAPAVTPSGLSPIPLRPPPGVNPNPEGQP